MKKEHNWLAALRCVVLATFMMPALAMSAQESISLASLPQEHPRYLTTAGERPALLRLIEQEPWAADLLGKLQERTDGYVARCQEQPDWLLSRLAMYWTSHATDVYVNSETFDHAGGERAPVATVRYTGTRGTFATHRRPRLEEVVPYDDADGNVTFCNTALEGAPLESVHPSKTGRNIESLNREVMGIARDAAFLYWLTGREHYAKMAAGVFDTYMQGIYYRNVPIDLNHGHQQTLVGMTSFEVIHEDILNEIVPLYDFLYYYLREHYSDRMAVYAAAFKKWADNIIANGVPHNNWNLIQARFIMNIGAILEDNCNYADGRGREYYIDYVLNRSTLRQWSLKDLADYGFDASTGIWAECPGYSCGVVGDYVGFVALFDQFWGYDLTRELPVVPRAVAALPQYLFPNRMVCGFGDTHPGYLNVGPMLKMVANARRHGKAEEERRFTALAKCLMRSEEGGEAKRPVAVAVNSFFGEKPVELSESIAAGRIEDYVSPTFYAPNVSWLAQRTGMDARHSLMISLNASEGNHMHANGIAMELYGKGYVLGPDAGIGKHLYNGADYAEYYSQFPSHNTVCVNGISSYPAMKSNHPFRLLSHFPALTAPKGAFTPATYSEVSFLEPESHAEQVRTTGIVATATGGYYVDIFRSRCIAGNDKMHDYFYHNLGQELVLTASDGADLDLQPTEELAFAGAHLSAYSYIYNKKMATTGRDVRATFTVRVAGGDDVAMTMWMKGAANRQVFSALSPATEGYSRTPGMPYRVGDAPTLTYVARQRGEAWQSPFVAIYEPSSASEPSTVASVSFPAVGSDSLGSHVGIRVEHTDGRQDLILSSDRRDHLCRMAELEARAAYALCCAGPDGDCRLLLMGDGTRLSTPQAAVSTDAPAQVMLLRTDGGWRYQASAPCTVELGPRTLQLPATNGQTVPIN